MEFISKHRFKILIIFIIVLRIISFIFQYWNPFNRTDNTITKIQRPNEYKSLLIYQNHLVYGGITKKHDKIVISNNGKFYYLSENILNKIDIYELEKNRLILNVARYLQPGAYGASYIFEYNDMLFLISEDKLYEINFKDLTMITGLRHNSTSFFLDGSRLFFLHVSSDSANIITLGGPISLSMGTESFSYIDMDIFEIHDIEREEYEKSYEKIRYEIDYSDRSFKYYGIIDDITKQNTDEKQYIICQLKEYNGDTYFLISGDGNEGSFFDSGNNIYKLDKENNTITKINPELQEEPQGFEIIDNCMYIKTFNMLYKYDLASGELININIE